MRLSKRSEYGIRAMLKLAKKPPAQLVSLKEIAQEENIPIKFLEQIFLALKNTGLLHSKSGRGGGYSLGKPAQKIVVGQVVRILDGPLAPINCVSETAYEPCDCPDEKTCGLRLAMLDVRNAIAEILDNTTLEDLLKRSAE
jgi:Rrf2 family protein